MEYHSPALLKESVDGLNIKPDGIYVDLTFGGGGHSKEILSRLSSGRLIAFDQDDDSKANIIDDKRFLFVKSNFRFFKNFLRYYGIRQVDGILADLGVSFHQFDSSKRGFSFRFDEELDMRMNTGSGKTAFDILNGYSEKQLTLIFRQFGEIHNAHKLSKLIVKARTDCHISTTGMLKEIISESVPKHQENKYLAKVFQALRIEVNNEIEVLKEMLIKTTDVIKKDGRLVIITYHSLEDRLAKNFIRKGKFEGDLETDLYGNSSTPFEAVNRKVIVPDQTEVEKNSRSRSAKLRIAKRN